jgi:putative flippase GtrA
VKTSNKNPLKKVFQQYKSLIIYFFIAGSGVIVQFIVSSFCIRNLNFPFQKAVMWGFVVSVPVSFILSKLFAFEAKGSGNTQREMIKYFMVLLISLLITVKGAYYTLQLLTFFFGELKLQIPFTQHYFNPIGNLSQLAGVGMSFVFNFITHRKFTFVETGLFGKWLNFKNSKIKS